MRLRGIWLACAAVLVGVGVSPVNGTAPGPGSMVTEAVETGVERVLSDGFRDLVPAGVDEGLQLAVGGDGSVWEWRGDGVVRLGDETTYPALPEVHGLESGADGTLWALSDWILYRLGGDGWSVARQPARGGIAAIDTAPDGRVWTAWLTNTLTAPYGGFGALGPDGWSDRPLGDELTPLLAGSAPDPLASLQLTAFRAAADGSAWMAWRAVPAGDEAGGWSVLLRFDGRGWTAADPVGVGSYRLARHLDVGADGTVWAYLETSGGGPLPRGPAASSWYLARFAEGAWSVFGAEDGVPRIHDPDSSSGVLAVGPDGRVWVTNGFCGGVLAFDGVIWSQFLDRECISDIDLAPDGSAWVVGGVSHGHGSTPTGVYRIAAGEG